MDPNKKRSMSTAIIAVIAVLAAAGAGIWYSKIASPEPVAEQETAVSQSEKKTEGEIEAPATKPESEAKAITETDPEATDQLVVEKKYA